MNATALGRLSFRLQIFKQLGNRIWLFFVELQFHSQHQGGWEVAPIEKLPPWVQSCCSLEAEAVIYRLSGIDPKAEVNAVR